MTGGDDRQGGIIGWNKRLYSELALLPDTLEQFRTGVQDLSRVAKRLEAVTEVIERTQGHLDRLGITEAARQLDETTASLQEQMRQVVRAQPATGGPPQMGMQDAVEQMQRTVAGLAELGGRLFGATLGWRQPPSSTSTDMSPPTATDPAPEAMAPPSPEQPPEERHDPPTHRDPGTGGL